MTPQIDVLQQLMNDGKQNSNINMVLGIITAASAFIGMIGAVSDQSGLMMFGIMVMSIFALVLIVRALCAAERKNALTKSLAIMESTGSIQYIGEIINRQYQTNGKECLSEHIYYIPGTLVLGYGDIVDIRRINNDYYFVTLTGKQIRVMAPKINKGTIEYLLNNYDITSGASYNDYKHKIENFQRGLIR